jgi:hypothetical protein
MLKYRLRLNGDPTKDIPWFYIPSEIAGTAKKTGVDAVDAPAAKYCMELIERGLIHLDNGSGEVKAGTYTVSEDGEEWAKEISN